MSQILLTPRSAPQITLLRREILLHLTQVVPVNEPPQVIEGPRPLVLLLKSARGTQLVLKAAVTGPRGRTGEGIDNFDGDPLLIYRLYSGMH